MLRATLHISMHAPGIWQADLVAVLLLEELDAVLEEDEDGGVEGDGDEEDEPDGDRERRDVREPHGLLLEVRLRLRLAHGGARAHALGAVVHEVEHDRAQQRDQARDGAHVHGRAEAAVPGAAEVVDEEGREVEVDSAPKAGEGQAHAERRACAERRKSATGWQRHVGDAMTRERSDRITRDMRGVWAARAWLGRSCATGGVWDKRRWDGRGVWHARQHAGVCGH
eukprot:1784398-Rhodomonas_salina.2